MQSSNNISTTFFDEALAQSPSFDKNMMDNVLTENQLIDTISNLEKQIAAIPQGQPIPDQLTYFLGCFRNKLKSNRDNRESISLNFTQKVIDAENTQFAALTQHGFFFNIEVPAEASVEEQHAIACLVERKIQEKIVPIFLQAVIDGDEKTVAELLDKNPELLMVKPPKDLVIESRHTWQRFNPEDALLMAVKRKQLGMIKLLLPYYDKPEQTEEVINAKERALSAWSFYEMHMNNQNEEEIVIPREYVSYANALVDVFTRETFPNGIPGLNGNPWYMRLSDETELALTSLFNRLLPEKAVNANYLDVELALFTAYKIYGAKFNTFQNWVQRDAFCVRVIGLIQGVLAPEEARIVCGGFLNFMRALRNKQEPEISEKAAEFKLKDSTDFYRDSRLSHSGLGFEFLCAFSCWTPIHHARWSSVDSHGTLKDYVEQKQQVFAMLCRSCSHSETSIEKNWKQFIK